MTLHIDGFEQFKGDGGVALMRMAGYTVVGQVAIAGGRKAGSSLTTYRSKVTREWPADGDISFGAAIRFDVRGPMLGIRKGADTLLIWIDDVTGLLNIGEGPGSGNPGYANPLRGRWYYLELVVDRAAGTASIFINGKLDSSIPVPSWLTGTVTLELNPYDKFPNDYGTRSYDDFYASDVGRLQPIQVTTRFPTADGSSTDWSVAGAGNGWQAVSPPIDMLEKFIYSAVHGAKSSFVSSTAMTDNNPIRYLQLLTLFRKATPEAMSLIFNIDGQTVPETNIPRDWTLRYTQMDPSGYTAANIVNADFGVTLQ